MNVKDTATKVIAVVKTKPFTIAYTAWVAGCLFAPVTTILASLVYTGITLGANAAGEFADDLREALAKREAQLKETAHVP